MRQKAGGSGEEGRWGVTGKSRASENQKHDLLYEKNKSIFQKQGKTKNYKHLENKNIANKKGKEISQEKRRKLRTGKQESREGIE